VREERGRREVLTRKWALLGIIVVASVVGGAVAYWKSVVTREPLPPAACEIRTFDHVGFMRVVDSQKAYAGKQVAALANATDPVERLTAEYLSLKLESLSSLAQVVDEQVRKGGSTYSCVDPAYWLFMTTLDYPTFAGLNRQAEFDYFWNRVAKEINRPWWLTFAQGAAGSLPTAIVGAVGLYLVERRERRKAAQRIQLAERLPQ
jgi:hypothetical protein